MAESQLSTVKASGTQGATQNPQSVNAQSGVAGGTASRSVQPGTASNVLTSGNGGITLQTTPLTQVDLSTNAVTTQPVTTVVAPARHHFNPVLMGISIILCLIALVLFWTTMRSAKNTTNSY